MWTSNSIPKLVTHINLVHRTLAVVATHGFRVLRRQVLLQQHKNGVIILNKGTATAIAVLAAGK